ncbi:MAG: hypothetical protein QMC97_03890, partial [Pseudothermotoga sp.]|nr:hypothetical protein [Pseudothermotoga sp.]
NDPSAFASYVELAKEHLKKVTA